MKHWQTVKLSAATTKVGSGATPQGGSNAYKDAGTPLIRSQNVRFEGFDPKGLAYLDDEQADELKNVEVRANDVLLNITGASIGRVTLAPLELDGARVNQHVCIIRPKPGLDAEFLSKYFASPSKQRYIMSNQSGATRQALTKAKILDYDIPLPPLNEQRRIVAKIEDLTARSQAAKQALDAIPPLLERFRQSVLAAAFRGDLTKQWRQQNPNVEPASELLKRIRQERRHRWEQDYLAQQKAKGKTPKDDKWKEKYQEPEPVDSTNLPALPEGWCWAAGRELFAWSSGKNLPQKEQKPGPYPVYGGNGVSGHHNEYLISNSTLVIGRVGAQCGNVYWTDSESWITDNAIYATNVPESVNLKFSVYLFRAAELNKKAGGSGQPFVNQPLLNELLIALPPAAEQNAIVESLEQAESVSAGQTRYADEVRTQMARLNQSVLAKAFRGELVPQDPNDEPAFALLERIRAEREATHPAENGRKRKGRAR